MIADAVQVDLDCDEDEIEEEDDVRADAAPLLRDMFEASVASGSDTSVATGAVQRLLALVATLAPGDIDDECVSENPP